MQTDAIKFAGFTDEAGDGILEQIAVTKQLGWNSLELRSVDGKQIAALSDKDFDFVVSSLDDAGVHVCSIGSNIASWAQDIRKPFSDTKELVHVLVQRAKRLNPEFIRIMSYSILKEANGMISLDQLENERFKRLNYIVKAFADVGVTAVHENCFTYGGLSYEHTLRLLENVPGLKLVFDTGNPPIDIDVRTPYPYRYQDSYEFYSNVKPYIEHVHIKDSYIDENGNECFVFPGEGKGDVKRIISDLLINGYDSYFSIEPHMEVVFHDTSKTSSHEKRMQNYVDYGQKLEKLIASI